MVERTGAKFMRGLVKTVFILCYVAFMWASIHHVATFFNNFEAGNGNEFGSYVLAGAFDVTALVTTIAVMFFRKSMPRGVQVVVWGFILLIAGYSYFINWEYTSHFQATTLTLQPTGATTPVFDQQGQLHYVPVMAQNTFLLWVNPAIASGFVVFSLVYSVIAEFFGTKPPSYEELKARKDYLEKTKDLRAGIKVLESADRGLSWIERGKQAALEARSAVGEVLQKDESNEESSPLRKTGFFDRRRQEQQAIAQMRALLIKHSVGAAEQVTQMKPKAVRLLAETEGLWDMIADEPTEKALGRTEAEQREALREEALLRGLITPEQVAEEALMEPAHIQYRYLKLEAQIREEQEREAKLAQLQQWESEQRRLASADEGVQAWIEAAPPEERGGIQLDTAPGGTRIDESYEDWLTVDEFAAEFHIAPATVGYWSRPDASEPKKIYEHETGKKLVGAKTINVINPTALVRIRKALVPKNAGTAEQRNLKKGDSNPQLSLVSLNGNHGANGQN